MGGSGKGKGEWGIGNSGNKTGTFCTLRALLEISLLQSNIYEKVGKRRRSDDSLLIVKSGQPCLQRVRLHLDTALLGC